MKKVISLAFAVCIGVAASAQGNEQVQNKNGVDIMPVSGEFAVGIGASYANVPTWIGNLFGYVGDNNSVSGASSFIDKPEVTSGAGVTITGKYMVSDNNALRVSVYNGGFDNTSSFEVFDDRANHPDSVVIDKFRENNSTTYLSAGWEFRRGKTRLRGIYGGDAVISWSNGHEHYTYGNNLGLANLTPTDAFGAWHPTYGRVTQIRNGATFGLGVRAFVGVEFYIAPKMCIGTEFGWSARMTKSGKSVADFERFDPFADNGNGAIVTHRETNNLGGIGFNTGIDNFNSQVYFMFYF